MFLTIRISLCKANLFVICSYCVLFVVIAQTYVDDSCERNGVSGKCQYFEKCSTAISDLRKGIPPLICSYEGSKSVICCVVGGARPAPQTTTTTQKTTTTTRRRPVVTSEEPFVTPAPTEIKTQKPPPGARKSLQKCYEYGKYVYAKVPSQTFLPGDEDEIINECGLLEVELIVGGIPAKPKEFPHMALIGFNGDNNKVSWECGGALISENYVLTAGHCMFSRERGWASYVRIGDLVIDRTDDDAKPQEFGIAERIPHPQYLPPSQYHDIALVKLDKPAVMNAYARPACLYAKRDIPQAKAVASGWGNTEFAGSRSTELLQVTLELFTNAHCRKTYPVNNLKLKDSVVDDSQLCAGSHSKERDTCQGDSGGPLQINNKEVYCMYDIIGVTSFGKACGRVNIPGVYSRVSNYIDWIESVAWP